jgi:fatty-acyl-CoA synthase
LRQGQARVLAECAVLGIDDQRWGEVPVAAVVATRSSKRLVEELTRICDARLAKYKRPRHFFFVDELPRNSIGKVQKHVLKDKWDALLPK